MYSTAWMAWFWLKLMSSAPNEMMGDCATMAMVDEQGQLRRDSQRSVTRKDAQLLDVQLTNGVHEFTSQGIEDLVGVKACFDRKARVSKGRMCIRPKVLLAAEETLEYAGA